MTENEFEGSERISDTHGLNASTQRFECPECLCKVYGEKVFFGRDYPSKDEDKPAPAYHYAGKKFCRLCRARLKIRD